MSKSATIQLMDLGYKPLEDNWMKLKANLTCGDKQYLKQLVI